MSLPIVYVEWTVSNSLPGAVPGMCRTAGLLVHNSDDMLVLVQNEHVEAGATSGDIGIPWKAVSAAYYCATGVQIPHGDIAP